jgi:hypothetical protein
LTYLNNDLPKNPLNLQSHQSHNPNHNPRHLHPTTTYHLHTLQ